MVRKDNKSRATSTTGVAFFALEVFVWRFSPKKAASVDDLRASGIATSTGIIRRRFMYLASTVASKLVDDADIV